MDNYAIGFIIVIIVVISTSICACCYKIINAYSNGNYENKPLLNTQERYTEIIVSV
jgi:hypothetical protein